MLPTLLQNPPPEDHEFNLFLFALLILGIILICVVTVVAVILAVIALLVIFGLIAAGALSASVLIGLNKKSFTTGFRAFLIIFCTIASAVAGMGGVWFFNRIVHWWTQTRALTTGFLLGLLSGWVTGMMLAYVIRKLSTYLKTRIERRKLR